MVKGCVNIKYDLLEIRDKLEAWQHSGAMGKALLYRLIELIDMAKQEKELLHSKKAINLRDMTCLGWRSRRTAVNRIFPVLR